VQPWSRKNLGDGQRYRVDQRRMLMRDEARRIAANIAKLRELLGAGPRPDANALIQRRMTWRWRAGNRFMKSPGQRDRG
jgi:hypothetical protein